MITPERMFEALGCEGEKDAQSRCSYVHVCCGRAGDSASSKQCQEQSRPKLWDLRDLTDFSQCRPYILYVVYSSTVPS